MVVALAPMLAAYRPARAQPAATEPIAKPGVGAPGAPARSATFQVSEEGESFEVMVNPAFVTVLYFPEPVLSAISPNQKRFDIRAIGDSIAVKPLVATEGLTTNLNVKTKTMRVSVVLHIVGNLNDALSSAAFIKVSAQDKFEQAVADEVARRTAALEAEYRDKLSALEDEVRRRGDGEMAARVLKRHEIEALKAVDRNGEGVIVRVAQVVYLGSDAYVVFDVQNRDTTTYRIANVALRRGNDAVGGAVRFEPREAAETAGEAPIVGMVPSGRRGTGVIVVRDVDKWARQPLTLDLAGPGGTGRVTVAGIVLR